MSGRPTPEEIIAPLELTPGEVERALSRHGYVIVHPDDVFVPPYIGDLWAGFRACHQRVFGDQR